MTSFFLPAIKFLNNLKFSQKIAFATIAFMLPVSAFLTVSGTKAYGEYKNVRRLDHALVYTNALKTLYMNIPLHRGMMNARIHGNQSLNERIEKVRKKIGDDIKVIDALTLRYGTDFNTRKKWSGIKQSWEDRLPGLYNLSAVECFTFHTKLIEEVAGVIAIIGEHFRTSMSTVDLVDFYMMKVLTEDVISITEYQGRARAVIVGIAAKKRVSDAERRELLSLESMIKVWQEILHNSLESIDTHKDMQRIHTDAHSSFGHSAKSKKAIESTDSFSALLERYIISTGETNVDPASFFEEATAVINSNFELYDELSAELAAHIQSHYNDFVNKVITAVAILLIILLLLFYFNTAFYMSFMDSLKKIKDGAEKVGSGDYGHMIELQTKDELLQLSNTFNNMSNDLLKHNAFLNSYKNAIDKSAIVTITDPHGTIIHANDNFYEITGYAHSEVIGKNHDIIKSPQVSQAVCDDQWRTINENQVWHGILKDIKKSSEEFYADTTIVPIVDEKGAIAEFITIKKDVTELIQSRETLLEQLYTDILTGLCNRRKLIEDLKTDSSPSLVLINIDRYREINDYYGHGTGDEILMELKQRLLEFSKTVNASAYRLHADEFAMLLPEKNFHGSLEEVVESLHAELTNTSYNVKSGDFGLSATLSAATKIEGEKISANNVLINADLALRSARKQKKEFLIFDTSISLKAEFKNNLKWTKKLKEAIIEDRIVPYFQPIINNKTKQIEKYECLMRMIEEDGTAISPFAFLKTAKKAKLYTKLTEIMFKKSLEAFKESPYEFSINISVDDILDKKTVNFIKKCIAETPAANRMVLEIVESEGIEDFEEIRTFFQYAKSAGCKIAIDDFGTGYSNFEYLLKLNIDIIKIDGSLIKNIHEDEDAQRVVKTIIDFANKPGMQTVAEFVHSKEVLDKIEGMDIGYSQGYYFSEPKDHIV